nr:TSUP family transporter [Spirochaetota bacterium]
MELYIVLTITIFTSALIQGMTGFGSALVAMAILPLFLPVRTVTPLVLLVGLLLNIIIFVRFHQHFDMKKLFPIIIGAAAGVPIGVYGLKMIDERII